MAYNPITDFLGLLRSTGGGVRTERVPGLDYVISAMARMGFVTLYVGTTAPVTNQASTVWLLPASPSWTAEGAVFLWNSATGAYVAATPALWLALFALVVSGYSFQSAANPVNVILTGTTLLAVQRAAPVTTTLTLPNLGLQFAKGVKLQIIDFSTAIAATHTITLGTPDGAKIMNQGSWQLLSTADQQAGVQLTPCPDLNAWVIAP